MLAREEKRRLLVGKYFRATGIDFTSKCTYKKHSTGITIYNDSPGSPDMFYSLANFDEVAPPYTSAVK